MIYKFFVKEKWLDALEDILSMHEEWTIKIEYKTLEKMLDIKESVWKSRHCNWVWFYYNDMEKIISHRAPKQSYWYRIEQEECISIQKFVEVIWGKKSKKTKVNKTIFIKAPSKDLFQLI